MRKLLPLLLLLIGSGAGLGAGVFLRPPPEPGPKDAPIAAPAKPENLEYVKLPSQFVIPLMDGGRVGALVVLSLSLEVPEGQSDGVHAREPKLRDEFLRVLFEHANTGGFRGTFTDSANLVVLRRALKEGAAKVMRDQVTDVLITDIVRQDS
ncbi:MAG: flagellar basal body-associated FliL family protein [Gemmobacter sp.]|nr:flagellar basal body-associated FliL family protein [Gemmobacter sp.]